MGMMQEFKEFAIKGNAMDLAVGVIVGAAFGKIVDSIVNDLIMPLVGKVVGGLDFSNYYIALAGQDPTLPLLEAKKVGAVFAYGNFLTVALNFVILAYLGVQPPSAIGERVSQVGTLFYFGFFILMPWWSKIGEPKPVPARVNFAAH